METSLKDFETILHLINKEEIDSNDTIHMTANENIMSKLSKHYLKSTLSYRYHVGMFDDQKNLTVSRSCLIKNSLMLRCLSPIFLLEQQAREYVKKMFFAEYADFRPLSGMHTVFCILSTLTKPNDRVYVFTTESVGHAATVSLLKSLGRKVSFIPFCEKKLDIDLEKLSKQILIEKPNAILFDFGTPFYPLPIREIREIVGNDVKMIYDASHVLGLIAGGQFQNPLLEGCDVLIGNTHKTFPGPQKGMILYKNKSLGKEIATEIFKSAISAQHTHHAIALYVTIIEMYIHGKEYANQIIKNNHALSQALINEGFKIFKRKNQFSLSHMIAITGDFPIDHHVACADLHNSNISTNSRILYDFPAVRIGVQEVTRKGMKEKDMVQLAKFFKEIILDRKNISSKIKEFNNKFNSIEYSLDEIYEKLF
ncbi:MAG: hypothetical protein JXA94_00895 [Parachlamydiales bacterium]|nr:hypothetical protein [Parachlamydiales bacterium]